MGYQTELNRRAKWEREFQAKFNGMVSIQYQPWAEEPELEDGFVC